MKTKHILTALALPAIFAACTADDIVSNNGLQQAERAKLSKDFVLNTNNEVESRYAVVGSTGLEFVNEEGDLIGANLIDIYNPNEKNPAKWEITPYVAPSLPFKNVGGNEWKSDAELGVGNYLFTYPFNKADNGRAAAAFELPITQTYSSKEPNAFIEANNKAVAAIVLHEGETAANVKMRNIYTYPKVRINFDNGEDVKKVTKVVLVKEGGFIYKGGFNHEAIAKMHNADVIEEWLEDNEGKTEDDYWASMSTNDFIINSDDDRTAGEDETHSHGALTSYGKPVTTPHIVVEMNETVKANATTNNKSVEVRFMLPSEDDFNDTGITAHVVTDNGTYMFELDADNGDLVFSTANEDKIKAALSRSSSNTVKTVNLTLAGNKSDGYGNIVSTVADWNALVANYGANKAYSYNGTKGALEVAIISENFAFNKDAKFPTVALFDVTGPFSVAADLTIKNVNAQDYEVTVEEGATLTLDETFYVKTLTNKGNVVVVDGANVQELNNEGTLTVKADAQIGSEAESRTANDVVITNEGTMTVEADGYVKAQIVNLKDLTVAGWVNSTVVNGADQEDMTEKEWKAANEAAVITMVKGGVLKGGSVTNKQFAKIQTAKDATTKVTDNEGEIIYVDGAELDADNEGLISYETADNTFGEKYFVDEDAEKDLSFINKLILTKDAKFTTTGFSNLDVIEVSNDVDVEVAAGKTFSVPTINFVGTTSIAKTTGTLKATVAVNIEEGADVTNNGQLVSTGVVNVEEGAKFTNNGTVTTNALANSGRIYNENNASFTSQTAATASESTPEVVGKWFGETLVVSPDTTPSDAQTAYTTALKNLLHTWIDGTSKTSWDDVNLDNMFASNFKTGFCKDVAEDLVEAYNTLNGNDEDFEEITLTDAAVEMILTDEAETLFGDDEEELGGYALEYKNASVAALKSAIETAVTNSYITTSWLTKDYGYAYVGSINDYKQMYIDYAAYLKTNLANVTVEGEAVNKVNDKLKNSLLWAIEAVEENLASVSPVDPQWEVPAGSFIDASDVNGANYVVISTYVNEVNESGALANSTYTLNDIKTWVSGLKTLASTAASNDGVWSNYIAEASYNAISSHLSTVATWNKVSHSDKNIAALAPMVKAKTIVAGTLTQQELSTALNAGGTVNLNGTFEISGQLTITNDVKIVGGTLKGGIVEVTGAKVEFNGVKFMNPVLTNTHNMALEIRTNKDITIVNCTFEGMIGDAIQIVKPQGNVIVKNNTFVTPSASTAESYIHIATEKNDAVTVTYPAKVLIEGNTFGKVGGLADKAIKLNGPAKFSQYVVGKNTFKDGTTDAAKTLIKGSILLSVGRTSTEYNVDDLYTALTGTTLTTLSDTGAAE